MERVPTAAASAPAAAAAAPAGDRPVTTLELTILMPCLDEAETLATCIRQAAGFLRDSGVSGEVLIADNGSTDGSVEIAEREGARVVRVESRGYGAALLGGISAARGTYTVMGDADASYDFARLGPFVERLRAGADLVMGNRFKGGIAPGAMPLSHRYLGNPVLSAIGRAFFSIPVGDFHSGLRGFRTHRIRDLDLSTTGMEFASEMVVKSALAGYVIDEVPTTLARDGRSRPPHLHTWRDGWRHLRFLLLYSPRWLFLYPGLVMIGVGLVGVVALFPGQLRLGAIALDVHTFVAACLAVLIGVQSVTFGMVARRYATMRGLLPESERYSGLLRLVTLERMLLIALGLVVIGVAGAIWCVAQWAGGGFGPIADSRILRVLVLSFTALAAGLQIGLAGFLAGVMETPQK